jgi:MFS family permease
MLASANSWLAIGRRSAAVVGPAVAAGIYGTAGPPVVWGLEAVSFVVAAAAVVMARPRRAVAGERLGVKRELAEGFRYVASVAWLWMGILAGAVVMTVTMAPFTSLLPALVRDHYGRGVGAYGLLFSLIAAGMVAGSLVWARWNPPRHRMIICFSALALNDLGIIVVALSDSYPLGIVGAIWRGVGIGLGASAWTTLLTELVPEHLLSRVVSFDAFGSSALTPVGFALAAAAATVWPVTTIVAVGGSLGFVLWFAPLLSRRVREVA